MSTTHSANDAQRQTATVGISAAVMGALLALVATWAIGGSAAAGTDDNLADVDAAVNIGSEHGTDAAGSGTVDSTGTTYVCLPPDDGSGDGNGNGSGNGNGNGSGDGSGNGSGDGNGDGSGNGNGDGSGGNGDGNGTGTGNGNGDGGSLIDVDVDGDVNDSVGSLTSRNLLDAFVDTDVDNGWLLHGNDLLDGDGGLVVGGAPHGSSSLIDLDASAFADVHK